MTDRKRKSLYICYFGLNEPLVQSQVLPYLRQLAEGGIEIHLLTFDSEKSSSESDAEQRQAAKDLRNQGILWNSLRYHGKPKVLSTAYDVLIGVQWIIRNHSKHRFDILHARALVPAVMARVARFVGRLETRILFDLRGLIIEEYLDAGVLSKGNPLVPFLRWVERSTLKSADAVVVLSNAIRRELFPGSTDHEDSNGRPVDRIPCCFDESRFPPADPVKRERLRKEWGLAGRLVGIYTGSTSGVYLIEEMCRVFAEFLRNDPSFFPIVLTKGDVADLERRLIGNGFTPDGFMLTSADPDAVADYLSASDFAVAFYLPTFSRLATSPTKNAEYLAAGLPILTNAGIGDTTEEILEDGVGVILPDFNALSIHKSVEDMKQLLLEGATLRTRCRHSAEKRYSLKKVGGPAYLGIYERLFRS